MISEKEIIRLGPEPFTYDAKGNLQTRIGTVFLRTPGFVTIRGIHAMQRMAWIDELNRRREEAGKRPLSDLEIELELAESVDLLFDETTVLIRPDPRQMGLAIRGDELLQTMFSKRKIRYLNIQHHLVRDALRAQGEAWRMAPVPLYEEEIRRLIEGALVGIEGRAIYYYNRLTGTRFLTLGQFRKLGTLPAGELRTLLLEIQKNVQLRNRFANPEVAFLPIHSMDISAFKTLDFEAMDEATLYQTHKTLVKRFEQGVQEPYMLEDDIDNADWRKALSTALIHAQNDTGVTAVIEGLSPEFFMQIEWLPGGRVIDGELIFDPIFAEHDAHPEDEHLKRLCDHRARAILLNYLQEYSEIEYVNIGRTRRSLSGRKGQGPRVHVYIVEMKERKVPRPQVKIIRIQRWTVAMHLAEEKQPLLQAILSAEEYTDYVMDRRLGCRQLGMNLPPKMTPRRFREYVTGADGVRHYVWTGYFERDYIPGRATDKIPEVFYASPVFNVRLARLLGQAAAPNIIIGRAGVQDGHTIFDDGDEVLLLDAFKLPESIILSESTGAFTNYQSPYSATLRDYADAMNRRKDLMPNFEEAANEFVEGFRDEMRRIQSMYRRRKKGFDMLFRDRPVDPQGSIAYRWQCVLARLDQADCDALAETLRGYIQYD